MANSLSHDLERSSSQESMSLHLNANLTESENDLDLTTSHKGNRAKFAVLLVLQLLSLPCYLFVFYRFRQKRQLRESFFHHVILLLLIVSFLFLIIALPLTQVYLYTSHVYPDTNTFCSLWNGIHYSLNIVNLFLMAFASIERNWLIFHPWMTRSVMGKICLHYGPLLFCSTYPPLFYFGIIFIHECDSLYDCTQLLCLWPCFFYEQIWADIDMFVNNLAPLLTIPIFCSIIYIRVFIQKRAMKQKAFQWRRDKKMIVQLLAVSGLYVTMWMPLQLLGLVNARWLPYFLVQEQVDYLFLLPYMIHFLYPFIVLYTYRQEMLNINRIKAVVQPMVH